MRLLLFSLWLPLAVLCGLGDLCVGTASGFTYHVAAACRKEKPVFRMVMKNLTFGQKLAVLGALVVFIGLILVLVPLLTLFVWFGAVVLLTGLLLAGAGLLIQKLRRRRARQDEIDIY